MEDAAGADALPVASQPDCGRRGGVGGAIWKLRNALKRSEGSSRDVDRHTATASGSNVPAEGVLIDEEEDASHPTSPSFHDGRAGRADAFGAASPPALQFPVMPSSRRYSTAKTERMVALLSRYGMLYNIDSLSLPDVPVRAGVLRVERNPVMHVGRHCLVSSAASKDGKHVECPGCITSHLTRRVSDEKGSVICQDDDRVSLDEPTSDTSSTGSISKHFRSQDSGFSMRRPVIDRTIHTCHKCGSDFSTITSLLCFACGHEKCPRCKRQVMRFEYPYSDITSDARDTPLPRRVYRPPRQRVRQHCGNCRAAFKDPAAKVCAACLHQRCGHCPRVPKRRRPGRERRAGADREVLGSVERRFADISLPQVDVSEGNDS